MRLLHYEREATLSVDSLADDGTPFLQVWSAPPHGEAHARGDSRRRRCGSETGLYKHARIIRIRRQQGLHTRACCGGRCAFHWFCTQHEQLVGNRARGPALRCAHRACAPEPPLPKLTRGGRPSCRRAARLERSASVAARQHWALPVCCAPRGRDRCGGSRARCRHYSRGAVDCAALRALLYCRTGACGNRCAFSGHGCARAHRLLQLHV